METATVNSETIERYLELSSKITRLHVKNVWADYDKEADVLYLSFRKPQRAKKTVEMGDDVLIRSDGDEVVGITVLNAGSRGGLCYGVRLCLLWFLNPHQKIVFQDILYKPEVHVY